jgi:hypothetical protein
MDKIRCLMIACSASSLLFGCASSPPPAARAAEVEQLQCDQSTSPAEAARILETTKVIASAPIYSNVPTTDDGVEHRVIGGKLVVRPPEGVSAEQMTRILQCHGARALLSRSGSVELANDPYWLPGAWVDIRVAPENGNYAVTLEADTISRNLQVYARAAAYADAHPLDRSPAVP